MQDWNLVLGETESYCNDAMQSENVVIKHAKENQLPKPMLPNIIQRFKQGMTRLSSESEERPESAAIIAASRALRSGGGDLNKEIEYDGDCDEYVEFENFPSSLDEQPSDAELDED